MNTRGDIARPRKHDEGMALLISLLFIVLLTVLVVEYAYETQVDTALVDANLSDFQALIAAKSAVAAGVSLLTADLMTPTGTQSTTGGAGSVRQATAPASSSGSSGDTSQTGGAAYDSLDEAWAYGVPFEQINNAVMQCSIDDEFGKLNLNALINSRRQEPNALLEQTLRYLFAERGVEDDPTDAILDWIDTDDEPRQNGAENDYYQSLSVPYPCKNAPMNSVEELLLIRGVTPEMFFGSKDLDQLPLTKLLTVHGQRNGRINLNTAPPELLLPLGESLGMGGLADLVVEERQRLPFSSNQDLLQRGIQAPQEASGQTGTVSRPFTVSSTSFRIQGNGICGNARVRIEAFLQRDAGTGADGIRLLDWREIR